MVSEDGTALFVKLAVLFLLACLLVLFTMAAIADSSDARDGDATNYSYGHAVQRV